MKRLTTLFALLLVAQLSVAQFEYYYNGQQINTSTALQIDVPPVIGNSDDYMIYIKNITSDTLSVRMKQCRLNDSPAIDGDYIVYALEDDQFGGIGFAYGIVTFPCWEMPDNASINQQLLPGKQVTYTHVLHSTGNGCEAYRYYMVEAGGTVLDSIDVNYCGVLNVDELSTNTLFAPNSASGTVYVSSVGLIDHLKWYNIGGEFVEMNQVMANNKQVDISTLPEGIYIVSIQFKDGIEVRKKVLVQ